jgi:hypothetical protein
MYNETMSNAIWISEIILKTIWLFDLYAGITIALNDKEKIKWRIIGTIMAILGAIILIFY